MASISAQQQHRDASCLVIEEPDLAAYLKAKLTGAVSRYAELQPRSRQTAIGASEIGNPCDRALAWRSLGYAGARGANRSGDPWAAFIGTAVHEALEKVFRAECAAAPDDEFPWAVETSVELATGIRGKLDLYETETATVIDHKVPADSVLKKAMAGDISETYFVQVQCYGWGFARAGFPVANVAIAYWPRGNGAHLQALHIVTWPYDPSIAERALSRWYALVGAAIDLDLETYPERGHLLATADAPCAWCPYFSMGHAGDVQPSCPGHKSRR